MNAIGIIANPASGKDIRRLVAYGTSSDNMEKINMIRRVLMGARTAGIRKVYYMPEYFKIVEAAAEGMHQEHKDFISSMEFVRLDMYANENEGDTVVAAQKFSEMDDVKCVVVLGGDGTSRAAAKGIGDTPLISVSTGTNNVFPEMLEGTIVGMAAGAFASGKLDSVAGMVLPTKRLDIYKNGTFCDIALIDAVILDEIHTASRAMWKTETFLQIYLTTCEAHYLGISSIGGQLEGVSKAEAKGLVINIDPDRKTLTAPIAPGLFIPVGIADYKVMEIDEAGPVIERPCVIAVDGERNIEVFKGESAFLKLTWNGPKVLNVHKVLEEARKKKLFHI